MLPNLRNIRLAKKIKKKDLASKAKISITTLTNMEIGNDNITLNVILRVAEVLNVDILELFVTSTDILLSKKNEKIIKDTLENIMLVLVMKNQLENYTKNLDVIKNLSNLFWQEYENTIKND